MINKLINYHMGKGMNKDKTGIKLKFRDFEISIPLNYGYADKLDEKKLLVGKYTI